MNLRNYNALALPISFVFFSACGTQEAGTNKTEETSSELVSCEVASSIEIDKSLIVTDHAILTDQFSFQRVMEQIVSSANPTQDAQRVYHRWWDTQNSSADAVFSTNIHCDDERAANGVATFNGYPYECSRNEGALANEAIHAPFCSGEEGCTGYSPIGIVNRFDLAPEDGSHCGEYRLIYAETEAGPDRNLIIFEAQLPNPNPEQGLEACRPVAEFWARLSQRSDADRRRDELDRFFFAGLRGFSPVVTWTNFTHGSGQIRTNQFMTGPVNRIWQLREFRTECAEIRDGQCALNIVPDTVKGVANGRLFDPNNRSAEARIWQGEDPANFDISFIAQIQNLVGDNVGSFSMNVDEVFVGGQSTSQVNQDPSTRDSDYTFWLSRGTPGNRFTQRIEAELQRLQSNLTPQEVVERAAFTTCGGCHEFSSQRALGQGVVASPAARFVHVSEISNRDCNGGQDNCFAISAALANDFLPSRHSSLEDFLSERSCGPTPVVSGMDLVLERPTPAPRPPRRGNHRVH